MGEVEVKLFRPILAILGLLCLSVAACQSNTKFKEDMLSSCGFQSRLRPTTAGAGRIVEEPAACTSSRGRPTRARTLWVYSDPTICGCLYVGNQAAYDAYLKEAEPNRRRST